MKPYTRATADADLQDALAQGDLEAALAIADQLDHMPPPPPPSLGGAALWYAANGFHVFPLQPLAKTPLPGSHGCKDATNDTATVTRWWTIHPHANIGLATGHRVDVIDFDGPEGHAAWGRTWPSWPDADVTIIGTVSTPRPGGLHVYLRATGAGNRANLVDHVDYRGIGGYVVAPPSRTDIGSYTWLQALLLEALA